MDETNDGFEPPSRSGRTRPPQNRQFRVNARTSKNARRIRGIKWRRIRYGMVAVGGFVGPIITPEIIALLKDVAHHGANEIRHWLGW
jgi:hypothetical protein